MAATTTISITLNDAQLALIQHAAAAHDVTIEQFMRTASLLKAAPEENESAFDEEEQTKAD